MSSSSLLFLYPLRNIERPDKKPTLLRCRAADTKSRSDNGGGSKSFDIAHGRLAKEAAVFSVELADALVADFVGCARGVHAIQANQALVDLVSSFAAQKKVTPAQIALARLLAKKPWIVPIPGTTKLARLEENLGAATVELTTEDVRALEEPSSKIKLEGARYPKFHEQLVGR